MNGIGREQSLCILILLLSTWSLHPVTLQDRSKLCFHSSLSRTSLHETLLCVAGPTKAGVQILHIAIGTSISSFFCITLLICSFYHRRKFRSDRPPADHDHVEVRYVSAPTGCNTTDRLLMEDAGNSHNQTDSPRCQKVSMV